LSCRLKLSKQFGLGDGSLLVTEAKDGEIRLRPAFVYEPPVWSPEETAYFILINSMTKEEWDRNLPDVLERRVPSCVFPSSVSHLLSS